MPRTRFAVKQYDGGGATGYAVFKASSVRNIGDTVTWEHGVEPFRGYYGLSREEANMFRDKLEKEVK